MLSVAFKENIISLLKSIGELESNINEYIELGDRHNGNCVVHLKCSSGNNYIAKPRSSFGEYIFSEIEDKVFSLLNINYKTNKVIAKNETASLFNFIENLTIDDANKAEYFYVYGIRGALLFLLLASDISYENVICHTNCPIIIDAETLFSPNYIDFSNNVPNYNLRLDYCVLARTGFFSSNYLFSPIVNSRQLNLLSSVENQKELKLELSKFPICDLHTESIYIGWLDGVNAFIEIMNNGFIERLINNDSNQLMSLRIILRPTYEYIRYLKNGIAPINEFSPQEKLQLQNGDIPYFTHESLRLKTSPELILNGVRGMVNFAKNNSTFIKKQIHSQGI